MPNNEKIQYTDLSKEEKKEKLKTEPNEARFWTGKSEDDHGKEVFGQDNARNLAEKDGGKTLEMKLEEEDIEMPSYMNEDGTVSEDGKAAWKEASEYFAEGASGDVKCYKGDKVEEDSVYNTTEKPTIAGNTDIKSVSEVDNVNGNDVKVIYSRNSNGVDLEDSQGNAYQDKTPEKTNESQVSEKVKEKQQEKDDGIDYFNGIY